MKTLTATATAAAALTTGALMLSPEQAPCPVQIEVWGGSSVGGVITLWSDGLVEQYYAPNDTYVAMPGYGQIVMDLNADGVVSGTDLGELLAAWGETGPAMLEDPYPVAISMIEGNSPAYELVRAWSDGSIDLVRNASSTPEWDGWVRRPACHPADLNGDGIVDGGDLGILLSNW